MSLQPAEAESFVYKGKIVMPYRWTTGKAVGHFLTELRDNKKIIAGKCQQCGRILLPPPDVCAECFIEIKDWVDIKDEGVLTSYTVVYKSMLSQPKEPPYTVCMIRLDGADTEFMHFLSETDEAQIKIGARVKAVWKEQRTGSILDIEHFELMTA